jgi:Holliday junction resolvase RusA-like endonuclease
VRFEAYGLPAAQGSKKLVGGRGKAPARMIDANAATLRPWRDTVTAAAIEAKHSVSGCIEGYVAVRCWFTFPKPDSAYRGPKSKKPRQLPAGKDLDKLVRGVFDALGRKCGAGLIEDDMRVIELTAVKSYPNEHPEALDCPGVRIEVRRLTQ